MIDAKNSIPRWVSLLYRSGQTYIGERLKHLDIGKGQHIFLNALYKEDGLSQEQLSDYLKIDKGTTAKALKKLEEQGYVTRTTCENDKRRNRVRLTPKALAIQNELRAVLADWRERLTYGFNEEEKQAAGVLLEKMGRNAGLFAAASLPLPDREAKAKRPGPDQPDAAADASAPEAGASATATARSAAAGNAAKEARR